MKTASALLLCAGLLAPGLLAAAPVSVTGGPEFDIGWDAGEWNKAKFTFTSSEGDWTVQELKARWKGLEDDWTEKVDLAVPEGKSASWLHRTHCPKEGYGLNGKDEIVMAGSFSLQRKGAEETLELPFEIAVKRAVLEEPLMTISGRWVRISLQKSRFDGGLWQKEALQWMDEAFEAMEDLTGRRPYGDELTGYRESPNRYAWAYAGQTIVLNGSAVPETVGDFKQGLMSFGWTHEMGHNFDCDLRPFLRWSTPSVEFQANIKLLYAFEHMPSAKYLSLRWKGTEQYPLDKEKRIPVSELGDRFFLCFGDSYLADTSRSWETLSSDDLQAFFYRIVKIYGWDALKRWYRLIGAAKDSGLPAPRGAEEIINFQLAALNKACGQNLLKTYQLWRLPVTEESLKAAADKYNF